jgi:hypothetical protein
MKARFVQNQSKTNITENEKIILFVFSSAFGGRKIRVNSLDPLSVLFQLMSSQDILMLYQGIILNPTLNFVEYGITQGD